MTISDLLSETYTALTTNKIRTGLTMLGIIIGISSVIVLVGVGQGATASVTSSISALGSNLLIVSPGASRFAGPVSGGSGSATTLTLADAQAIKTEVPDAKYSTAVIINRYQVTYKGNNTNTQIIGTEPDYTAIRNVNMDQGSFFSTLQLKTYAKVVILGPTTSANLFAANVSPIGQTINIKKVPFRVIGLTVAQGGISFNNADDAIYIPYTTDQRYLTGGTSISAIDITAKGSSVMNAAQEEVTNLLLNLHHISDPAQADFNVINQTNIISSLSTVTNTLTTLLGAIAGISLLVGGIGIMNMMLTTVTERTREIGLRQAIGAKKKDISMQFLVEAIVLTFTGGLFGIILGWLIAYFISNTKIVAVSITLPTVLMAFGVSALVGIIFGLYPALKAAGLRPIDALKYE